MEETNNDQKEENIRIEHVDNCLKQTGKPICGIYAFLNGLLAYVFIKEDNINCLTELNDKFIEFDENDVESLINGLWYEALDKEKEISEKKENYEVRALDADQVKYSLIGEFFSSASLSEFIEEKLEDVLLEYRGNKKLLLGEKETICAEEIESEKAFDEAVEVLNQSSNGKQNSMFFIIPINSKNNMHWICLIYVKDIDTYCILNSACDYCGERIAKKQYKLRNGQCSCWCRRINNFRDLKKVWEDIRDNKKDYAFKFGEWSKKEKTIKLYNKFIENLPEKRDREEVAKLKKRGKDLPNSNLIFDYNKSKFNIIKVTISEKEDDK